MHDPSNETSNSFLSRVWEWVLFEGIQIIFHLINMQCFIVRIARNMKNKRIWHLLWFRLGCRHDLQVCFFCKLAKWHCDVIYLSGDQILIETQSLEWKYYFMYRPLLGSEHLLFRIFCTLLCSITFNTFEVDIQFVNNAPW